MSTTVDRDVIERDKESPYLLLAEDDDDLRALLAGALRMASCRVVECSHGMELLDKLERIIRGQIDPGLRAIITDIRMPGITGMSILEGLHELNSQVPLFVITAFGSAELHERAAELGAIKTFNKPFDIEDLVGTVLRTVVDTGAQSQIC